MRGHFLSYAFLQRYMDSKFFSCSLDGNLSFYVQYKGKIIQRNKQNPQNNKKQTNKKREIVVKNSLSLNNELMKMSDTLHKIPPFPAASAQFAVLHWDYHFGGAV